MTQAVVVNSLFAAVAVAMLGLVHVMEALLPEEAGVCRCAVAPPWLNRLATSVCRQAHPLVLAAASALVWVLEPVPVVVFACLQVPHHVAQVVLSVLAVALVQPAVAISA